MCHLLLLLPLVALPVFWILPLAVSVPAYGVVVIVSAVTYWYAIQAMRRPAQTGAEGMIGATGEVVEDRGADLLVRVSNELWSARSPADLRQGDGVEVVAVERLILRVKPFHPRAATPRAISTPPVGIERP